ncbi:MAG: hypothetical protein Q7U33_11140 [Methylotenera sp.]|uniref:hypothetical protein n=1 Tax=Methylotenera sp. TaxID=2051956 RepID=UPI002719BB9D|nr:hypothetical protein [Methylotenera sp.]MDO9151925.1 hypothetical protein [Methylotenera sp.]
MVLSTVSIQDCKSKDSVKKNPKPNGEIHSQSSITDAHKKLLSIAVTAYYKTEARCFEAGHEIQGLLEAEAEVAK